MILKMLGAALVIAFGIFLVIFGEGDDSPGAQGLGLLLAIGGTVAAVKTFRQK